MADKTETKDAGKAPEPEAEETQAAKDLQQHLAAKAEGSTETSNDPVKEGAGKTADAPKLEQAQEEAVKAAGLTPEAVLAMGDDGIATANRLVKQRADLSRYAGEADHLRKENKALKAKKPIEDSPNKVDEISEDDVDEDRHWDKANKNFKNAEQRLGDLEEKYAKLASGSSDAVDSEGVRDRDEFFAGLGPEWPQFGEGPMDDLQEYSPEAIARDGVVDLAKTLVTKAGMEPAAARKAALISLYPEQHTNAAVRGALKANEEKETGSVETPSGGTGQKTVADQTNETHTELAKGLAGLGGAT